MWPLDGKTLRRSHDRATAQAALHLVSAWASANRLVLGQVAVDDKANEIAALPALIELAGPGGCIVTIDAMGCQTAIVAAIIEQQGDYVLALKDNQGTLHREVEAAFAQARATQFRGIAHATYRTIEKGHGRIEERRWWTIHDPEYLAYLNPTGAWRKLASVAMVERERTIGGAVTRETHYYIAAWPRRRRSGGRCGCIGASRTRSIGCSISPSGKMSVGCARGTAPRTSRPCATWRSTCCARSGPPRAASRPSASAPDGTKHTSSRYSVRSTN